MATTTTTTPTAKVTRRMLDAILPDLRRSLLTLEAPSPSGAATAATISS